jgi:hypothetical protein
MGLAERSWTSARIGAGCGLVRVGRRAFGFAQKMRTAKTEFTSTGRGARALARRSIIFGLQNRQIMKLVCADHCEG